MILIASPLHGDVGWWDESAILLLSAAIGILLAYILRPVRPRRP